MKTDVILNRKQNPMQSGPWSKSQLLLCLLKPVNGFHSNGDRIKCGIVNALQEMTWEQAFLLCRRDTVGFKTPDVSFYINMKHWRV